MDKQDITLYWNYAGKSVFVATSIDSWKSHKMDLDDRKKVWSKTMTVSYKTNIILYKFIVDNRWCYDVMKPTSKDPAGNINNIMYIVQDTTITSFILKSNSLPSYEKSKKANSITSYSSGLLILLTYTKDILKLKQLESPRLNPANIELWISENKIIRYLKDMLYSSRGQEIERSCTKPKNLRNNLKSKTNNNSYLRTALVWELLFKWPKFEVTLENHPGIGSLQSKGSRLTPDELLLSWINNWIQESDCGLGQINNFIQMTSRVYLQLFNTLFQNEIRRINLNNNLEEDELVVDCTNKILGYGYLNIDAIRLRDENFHRLFVTKLFTLRDFVRVYSVLFTQCLQEDYCGLVDSPDRDRLPNLLHIGQTEALRLFTEDADNGPMGIFLGKCKQESPDDLAIIHIKDWHESSKSHCDSHLNKFGSHCIANTKGSEFVVPALHSPLREMEFIVHSSGLSDFEGTNMLEIWEKILRRAGGRPILVGVVGVWTDAKVTFLIYDISTRLKVHQVATASNLTASPSRIKHFMALNQLHSVLDVIIYSSYRQFYYWLVPKTNLFLSRTEDNRRRHSTNNCEFSRWSSQVSFG